MIVKLLKSFLFGIFFLLISCGQQNPSGTYSGNVKDWVEEIFAGTITMNGEEGELGIVLRRTPNELLASMSFQHPTINSVLREGKWDVGDGQRVIRFNDGREPSEYFLIERKTRFAFQTKEGLSNDDGSEVLLMRNEGLSRKTSYPVRFVFGDDKKVLVERGSTFGKLNGEWKWSGSNIVLSVKMKPERGNDEAKDLETYKFFLKWDFTKGSDLLLEKMVILKPFLTHEGTKRRNFMSSISFPDMPRFTLANSN
jgi:hypothetical protein